MQWALPIVHGTAIPGGTESVRLRVAVDEPWDIPADVLVVPIVGEAAWDGPLGELDRRARGEIRALQVFGELRSKQFTSALAPSGDVRAGRILLLSVGPAVNVDRETVVHAAAAALHRLAGRQAATMAIWLEPLIAAMGGDAEVVSALVARGVVEGGYDPATIYRENVRTAPPVLDELTLIAPTGSDVATLTTAAVRGQIIGEGSNIARTLSNRASNDVSPEVLAEEAWAFAEKHGLWIDVIGPERATEMGMGMFMAVGRGSDNPPRMIVLRSGKAGEHDALGRHLALVGKGVCFDSGGISIKPAGGMEEMKMDKSGACTVIAAIATVARLAPGTPLLAVAPAVENMPGPHSARPGDLVKALNGKWVDITNTDAEGRLILGDAMTYAEQLGATHLVDVATLTGAVSRALGDMVAGAFGNDQAWTDQVLGAGSRAGERYWQMPLVEDYWSPDMESWYGDMVNSGTGDGGLIKSALFLREFVTRPWVHLDIAGTAYFRKTKPFAARGATGASHATLVELALAGARPA
ncbi:MAG: aminopeptidase [Chloroflexota bacterium]